MTESRRPRALMNSLRAAVSCHSALNNVPLSETRDFLRSGCMYQDRSFHSIFLPFSVNFFEGALLFPEVFRTIIEVLSRLCVKESMS